MFWRTKPQQQGISDRQIAEILIQTLEAQLNRPDILRELREGLLEGLAGINEVVAAYGGQIVAQINRPQQPRPRQQRARNYRR